MSLQARDAQSSMEEKYRNELNAHVKLSSLYKVGIAMAGAAWRTVFVAVSESERCLPAGFRLRPGEEEPGAEQGGGGAQQAGEGHGGR